MDATEPALVRAVDALRELILAGENSRQIVGGFLKLDTSETLALSYLYSRGEMGQSQLGSLLGFNTSTMTAVIDRLERDGIAERRPHPTDRRRTVVNLSTDGRQAVRTVGKWFAGSFDHIDPATLPTLTSALTTIASNMRTQALDMSISTPPATGSET